MLFACGRVRVVAEVDPARHPAHLPAAGTAAVPDPLEAFEVGGQDLAAGDLAQVPDRSAERGHAVDVRVDQELVVPAVDRVVQDGAVEPELDALGAAHRPVQHERVADLRGHRVVDALVRAPRGDLRAVRVTKQDPHPHAGAGLVGEDLLIPRVLGQEQPGVDQDADLVFAPTRTAVPRRPGGHPTGAGRRPAPRSPTPPRPAPGTARLATGKPRPRPGGQPPRSGACGRAPAGDPALDRLVINAEFLAQRGRRQPALQ